MIAGILAFVLSGQKNGSIEWHKREYLATYDRLKHSKLPRDTWFARLEDMYYKLTKTAPASPTFRVSSQMKDQTTAYFQDYLARMQQDMDKLRRHWKALEQLGYLVERRFALTNRSAESIQVFVANQMEGGPKIVNGRFWVAKEENAIRVIGPREVMPRYEKLISRLDALEIW